MDLKICELPAADIDAIAPLWDKLRAHQQVRSPHFPQHYARRTWKARRAELIDKGKLHIDILRDTVQATTVGYCVSTVSTDRHGMLESIYIEPAYRRTGAGDKLMKKALDWMDAQHALTKTLTVGVGNEEVLKFYARYGFHPKHITVEQVK